MYPSSPLVSPQINVCAKGERWRISRPVAVKFSPGEMNAATSPNRSAPKVIGNEYLVIGTLDRPDWQRGTQSPMPIREMVEHLHDFKAVVRFELVGGWQRE